MMAVDLCNDGPVTLTLDSKNREFRTFEEGDEPRGEQVEGAGAEGGAASAAPS